jgi:hypothetical protein
MVDEAFEQLRRVPGLPPWLEPGQEFLDAVIGATAAEPTRA